jgi:hypothetical protein
MTRNRQLLCLAYGLVAGLALLGTWSQNLSYFHADDGVVWGFVMATVRFWPETLATPASTSITVDIALFSLAASVFLLREARRLGMRGGWLYVVFGIFVAISVTFPLFLIARERRLAQRGEAAGAPGLTQPDALGVGVLSLATAIFSLWTIGH